MARWARPACAGFLQRSPGFQSWMVLSDASSLRRTPQFLWLGYLSRMATVIIYATIVDRKPNDRNIYRNYFRNIPDGCVTS
jgi:hypothetical protein